MAVDTLQRNRVDSGCASHCHRRSYLYRRSIERAIERQIAGEAFPIGNGYRGFQIIANGFDPRSGEYDARIAGGECGFRSVQFPRANKRVASGACEAGKN